VSSAADRPVVATRPLVAVTRANTDTARMPIVRPL
jgi:hypothetical protein